MNHAGFSVLVTDITSLWHTKGKPDFLPLLALWANAFPQPKALQDTSMNLGVNMSKTHLLLWQWGVKADLALRMQLRQDARGHRDQSEGRAEAPVRSAQHPHLAGG